MIVKYESPLLVAFTVFVGYTSNYHDYGKKWAIPNDVICYVNASYPE